MIDRVVGVTQAVLMVVMVGVTAHHSDWGWFWVFLGLALLSLVTLAMLWHSYDEPPGG